MTGVIGQGEAILRSAPYSHLLSHCEPLLIIVGEVLAVRRCGGGGGGGGKGVGREGVGRRTLPQALLPSHSIVSPESMRCKSG